MSEPVVALRAVLVLALLLIPGWALARLAGRRVDLFAATWWGLAILSLAGVLLARLGAFALTSLAIVAGGVAVLAWTIGQWRVLPPGDADELPVATRRVRLAACAAGLVACAWTWPPFETFMAAADSTMYVASGIHLARTGSSDVSGAIAKLLSPELAEALFPSVSVADRGPFIRLPGGLLMASRDAAKATPAFFPLVSMWAGVMAAVGGPTWAPVVAPLGMGLGVWALTLFAGEAFGLAAALSTALIFLANFAIWWFGRFPMSEPLTIAFIWGGLVFLGRGAPFTAGVMLGLGGVARAETLLFSAAALAWWAAWTPVSVRQLVALAAGGALTGLLGAVALFAAPSHHIAYLSNDLALAWAWVVFHAQPALRDGRLAAAIVLLPIIPSLVAVVTAWYGGPFIRNTIRVLVLLAIVTSGALYLRLGGRAEPLRHLGWLATSMSQPGLLLAVVGGGLVWSRGGPAVRLAVVLVVLVGALFVPNPRVADYQPWAMRRFLPVVLPGLAMAAGVALGGLMQSPRRALQAVAVVLLVAVVGLELRPVLAVREAAYFTDTLAGVRRLADEMPPDALVVLDMGFADLQIQVPLWLVFGRESILATGGGRAWKELLPTLVSTGRPVYWIQNGMVLAPQSSGLVFTPITAAIDLNILVPDSPTNVPPAMVIRRLVPLRAYGVTAGAAPPA